MERLIELSDDEAKLIVHALLTVAPSGGGSAPFHLGHRLAGQLGIVPDDAAILQLTMNCLDDAVEADVVDWVNGRPT